MAGISLSIGVSGSGKTYGLRRQVFRAASTMPILIIDRMREWNAVPRALAKRTAGYHAIADALADDGPSTLRIVRTRNLEADFQAACEWAYATDRPRGVACSEAHRVLPNASRLQGAIEDCVTAWRHRNVTLWLDTQRLSLLNRTTTEQATDLRLYAIAGDLDRRTIRASWGGECLDAVDECSRRLGAGDPGWHVPMGVSRLGPYTIAKE